MTDYKYAINNSYFIMMNNKSTSQLNKVFLQSNYGQKYSKFIDQKVKLFPTLQLFSYDKAQIKKQDLNLYESHTISKIMWIIQISNSNSDFLPILAINAQKIHNDYMFISALLMPFTLTSLRKIIKDNQQKAVQSLSILKHFHQRIQQLDKKYQQQLRYFQPQSYDFFIIQVQQQYKVVLGFTNFKVNYQQKSNVKINSYLQQLLAKKSEQAEYPLKLSQQLVKIEPINCKSEVQSYYLLDLLFHRYCETICDFIQQASSYGLTRYIIEDKILKRIDTENISMIDIHTKQKYNTQIYHNINCQHLQGITLQTFQSARQCPYCGNQLICQKENIINFGQNIFQMLIFSNFLNRGNRDVVYYLKKNVFTLKNQQFSNYKDQFSSYHHFRIYVQRAKDYKTRKPINLINNFQTISLYNKLTKQPKFYNKQDLINCPVRGRSCKHWEFYDLKRVYEVMLSKQNEQFQCFACGNDMNFQDIIYLRQMKQIINLTSQYAEEISIQHQLINANLKISHQSRKVELLLKIQNKSEERIGLNVYETVKTPLMKSRIDLDIFEQMDFTPPKSFVKLFYGY